MTQKKLTVCRVVKNDSKKLKYTYILRISIAIRCDVSTQKMFSMITLSARRAYEDTSTHTHVVNTFTSAHTTPHSVKYVHKRTPRRIYVVYYVTFLLSCVAAAIVNTD